MEPPSSQSSKDLRKIFDSFDLDKSGSVDLKQIGKVAAQLGKPLPQNQLAGIMKKLDSNKDGKISYGEFQYWWTKGMEGKMGELVYLKAKAMKLTNAVKNKFKAANIGLEGHKGNPKPDIYSIKVSFGAEVQDALKVDFGYYLQSPKQTELRQRIKSYVPTLTSATFGLILKIPSKNPAEAKAALDHIFNTIISKDDMPVKIESLQDNPFIKIKSTVKDKQLILQLCLQPELQNAVTPATSQAEQVIQMIGDGFYSNIDFNFTLNSGFDKILSQSLINNILRGFNVSFSLQANNSALGKFRKLAEKQQMGLPAFVNLLTLFRCAKLNLKIKSPEQLNVFFKKLGIEEVVGSIPSFKDLLQQMSPPLIEQSKSDLLVGLIYQFSRYAFKHVENDVQIFVLGGKLGAASLRLRGKNASKIHSILFNQL